ncbi:MAG: hypothetical protein ACREJ6_00665 [Candidatus Methylomirabilis sp.]
MVRETRATATNAELKLRRDVIPFGFFMWGNAERFTDLFDPRRVVKASSRWQPGVTSSPPPSCIYILSSLLPAELQTAS